MTVVVGIKAYNEEAHIADAVASARVAIKRAGERGWVTVGDCASTDGTVAKARSAGADHILRLDAPEQRSCGAGAQLAYAAAPAETEFFYLLDGDMLMEPDFLSAGIAFLRAHPRHAGVGGRLVEANTGSIEYELRSRNDALKGTQVLGDDVDRLDAGALYRAEAVRSVGWFGDRNLHSFEEFDLACRLRAAGWKLARVAAPCTTHFGHRVGSYRLMLHRLRTGYSAGPGELVRAALGRTHWPLVLRGFAQLHYTIMTVTWWIALLTLMLAGAWAAAATTAALPLAFLAYRRRSLRIGLYSLAMWNFIAVGVLQGLLRPRLPAGEPLPATDVTSLRA